MQVYKKWNKNGMRYLIPYRKMKYYRIRKSLDQVIGIWSKYVTKNWVEINDESTQPQNLGHHINLSFQVT